MTRVNADADTETTTAKEMFFRRDSFFVFLAFLFGLRPATKFLLVTTRFFVKVVSPRLCVRLIFEKFLFLPTFI